MKHLLYISALAFIMFISACSKSDLNPRPTNTVPDQNAFDIELRIVGQVRGVYATMKNAGFLGGRYQIFNDIRGRNFVNERTNVVTGFDIWNYTPSNSSANSVLAVWARAYYAINLVNVFLEGMDTKGTSVVGEERSKQLQGEVRFLRALNYYALLQLYARPYWDGNGSKPGVPLRLSGNTISGVYDLARGSVADTYAQILTDLEFAEQNLPLTYATDHDNVTRAHRNTAIALKTRVYLSMQRYEDVITEANKIVGAAAPFTAATGVAHALQPNIANVFSQYTTKESILSMPFTSVEDPGTQNQLGYYYGVTGLNGGNAEYSLSANGIVANTEWAEADARRKFVFLRSGKRYLSKYAGATPFIDWAPVIRYAEILLNLAEARVRDQETVDEQAIVLLNAVRGRSDAAKVFAAGDFADWQALANAIMTEREIELLGEGFAGADLTRLGLPLPAKGGGVSEILATGQSYIWPISSNELLLNKLCVDN